MVSTIASVMMAQDYLKSKNKVTLPVDSEIHWKDNMPIDDALKDIQKNRNKKQYRNWYNKIRIFIGGDYETCNN